SGIFATALLFSLMHFIPYWFLQLTALGVLLGLLTHRWNSIIPAFIVHSIINLWTLFYPQLGEGFSQIYVWQKSVHPLFITLGVILTWWGWQWNTRLFHQQL
ncbi:MAG: type II CAAX prenyl endopeptidase Rce1 family protein, partial [bacterium]